MLVQIRVQSARLPCLLAAAGHPPHAGYFSNALLSSSNEIHRSVAQTSVGLAENATVLCAGDPSWRKLLAPCPRTTARYSQAQNALPSQHTHSSRHFSFAILLQISPQRAGAHEVRQRIRLPALFSTSQQNRPLHHVSGVAVVSKYTAVNPVL